MMITRLFRNSMRPLEGRYQVTWPWKNDGFRLSDNYPVAITRLKMLVNHLHSDKSLLHKYNEIIQQKVKSNIIEKVDVIKSNQTKAFY